MRRMMAIVLFIVVGISLLASLVLVQPALASQVKDTTPGGYHLVQGRSQFVGESHGSGYHLQIPGSPSLTGNGCCCSNLPCVRKP